MKKVRWVSATAGAAILAATFALPGAGVAYASANGDVAGDGNLSLLSGNSVSVPISAPVNLCGVSLAVLGMSNSSCVGGASTQAADPASGSNGNVAGNGNVAVGSGNSVSVPITAPVNVCGVAGAVGGSASSQCAGGASTQAADPASDPSSGSNGNVAGNSNASVLSGNSVSVPVTAPVNLCGISLALLGMADSGCVGGAAVNPPPPACGCMSQDTTSAGPLQADGSAASQQGTTSAGPLQADGSAASQQGTTSAGPLQADGSAASLQGTGSGTALADGPDASGAVNAVTTANTASLASSGLPTTGADLLLLGVAALGSIGVGAGTVALARRRRNGTAA